MNIDKDKNSFIELFLIILILADTIILLGSIFYSFSPYMMNLVYIFDIIVCIILTIDYIFEYRNSVNKKEFFKYNWFYIIAFIPDYILTIIFGFIGISGATGLIRLIRLIRVGRVLILFNKNIKIFTNFIKETHLRWLLTFIVVLIISSSVAFFMIDESANTFGDGLWYVIVTFATVGYGDIVPASTEGKIIGFILLILGIVTFSILTAEISSIYTKKIEKDSKKELTERINSVEKQLNRIEDKLDKIINEKYR